MKARNGRLLFHHHVLSGRFHEVLRIRVRGQFGKGSEKNNCSYVLHTRSKGAQRIQDSVESYIGTAWAVSRENDQDRKSTAFLVVGCLHCVNDLDGSHASNIMWDLGPNWWESQ